MEGDSSTTKPWLPAKIDTEEPVDPQEPVNQEPVAAIQDQDEEALYLLQELQVQLNAMENADKVHIRKEDALPLLKRCIAVIEKATESSQQEPDHQDSVPELRRGLGHKSPDSNPRSEVSSQRYGESAQLNTIYLTQRTLKRQKQRLHRQGGGIHESERFTLIMKNERTTQERKDELQSLFDRVDAEKSPSASERTAVLREATNEPKMGMTPEDPKTQKAREIVTRTEIVPMLPCKGYGLPRGNLFIAGRLGSAETDAQLERIEQMQKEEELKRREVRRAITSRVLDAAKARGDKKADGNNN